MNSVSEDELLRVAAKAETAENGKKIILNFPTLEEAARMLNPWRDSASRAKAVSRLHEALAAVGLNVEIRVNGRSVVELGAESMRGALLTLLGLLPADHQPAEAR